MSKFDVDQDAIIKFYTDYNKRCPVTLHSSLYDTYYDVLEKKLFFAAMAKYCKETSGNGWALDLGCGAGRYLSLLNNTKPKTVGADISLDTLTNIRHYSFPLVCLDAHELPFKSNVFSLIISMFGVLSHCHDVEQVFKEVYAVINKGGICIISVCSWRPLYSILSIKGIINKWQKYVIKREKIKDAQEYAFDANIYTRTFWSTNMIRILEETGFKVLRVRGISILANLFSPEWAIRFPKAFKFFYTMALPIDYLILSRIPLIRECGSFLFFVAIKR